jgi:hypothetical protein
MVVPAVHGLDCQWLGLAHGDDDPSPGMPPGKFILEDVLGGKALSRYEGMLRRPRGSHKDDPPRYVSMSGGEFTHDGMGCAA